MKHGRINELFRKLRGSPITAARMKEIADRNGNVLVVGGGQTIVRANADDLAGCVIHNVLAVVVQSFGVVNVRLVEPPFVFRDAFWAYTADDRADVVWLYYWLESRLERLRRLAGVHAIPKLLPKDVDSIEIRIPDDVERRAEALLSCDVAPTPQEQDQLRQITAIYERVREELFAKLKIKSS